MAWAGLTLTVSGRDALNQAQLSNQMNIKSVVVGDGHAPTNFGTVKGLVHQLYELTDLKIDIMDGECMITADFPKVDYDYYFREIGVIVSTGDGDVLYVYDNCGDDAQYIVGSTGLERTHKRIRLSLLISDVSNITVSSPNILYVAYDEYEEQIETLRQETVSKNGDTITGNLNGSGGGVFATDGNVYLKSQGYEGWLTNFLGQYGQSRGTFQGDIDTLTSGYQNGFYWIPPTASGTKPFHFYFNLLVLNVGDTNTVQIAVSHRGNGVAVDTYVRNYINEVWSEWNRLLAQTDLSNYLGGPGIPVIQSATDGGGLMEIGKYIDFHDAGSQADFDARLYCENGELVSTSPIRARLDGCATSIGCGGDNKHPMTFHYSGQAGQPLYVWGSNTGTGTDNYVWSPGNFNVNSAVKDGNGKVIADTYFPKNGGILEGDIVILGGALFADVTTAEKNIIFEAASGVSFDCSGSAREDELKPEGTFVNPLKVRDGIITASQIDEGLMLYVTNGGSCSHEFYSYWDKVKRGMVRIMESEVQAGNFASLGGDYAEYWEWADGNSDEEDRVGCFVTFVGKNIRIAKKGDNLVKVGVVSATPSIVGDSDQKEWPHKYQKDIYGRDIWEDVEQEDGTVVKDRILNPVYDETKQYIKRADRPEWDAVGTHGKLVVRDDGTCQPDGFCVPTDGGIATAADDGFYVMERLDESHIRIYMK